MVRSIVMSLAAMALMIGSGVARADGGPAGQEQEVKVGKFRFDVVQEDNDKELTRGWHRGGWGGHSHYYSHSYYRPYRNSYYYQSSYYYQPSCYYYQPSCYYYQPSCYYSCLSGSLGGDLKNTEPSATVERAEMKMKLPASLLGGSK